MKRFLALLLLALMLPWCALAQEGTLNAKTATRTGPGTQYTEEIGTLNAGMQLQVIAQVDTGTAWYHVEFTRNGSTYRIYVLKNRVTAADEVPYESNDGIPDTVLSDAKAHYGPGESYAARPGTVKAGTEVKVACVEGEWALCDYREDWRWARGYLPVSSLMNTQAAPYAPTPAAEAPAPWSPQPEATAWDAAPVSGQALTADELPFINAAQVCFLTAATDIYSGPGNDYAVQTSQSDLASLGILGAGVRTYGQENGWALIRYPSGEPGEYRYGFVLPDALASADGGELSPIAFGYVPAAVRENVYAAEDPDILAGGGALLPAGTAVTALGCLNSDPGWVYCEFTRFIDGAGQQRVRGFLPAQALLAN